MSDGDSVVARGRGIQAMRLHPSSRKCYERRIVTLAEWLKANEPSWYREETSSAMENIVLPLPERIIIRYLSSQNNVGEQWKSAL